ncbi:unnamed protein product, partial [Ilex paraguariensis]
PNIRENVEREALDKQKGSRVQGEQGGQEDYASEQTIEATTKYFEPQMMRSNRSEPQSTIYERFKKTEEEAKNWQKMMDKIFKVMGVTEEEKVILGTFMLVQEAQYW